MITKKILHIVIMMKENIISEITIIIIITILCGA